MSPILIVYVCAKRSPVDNVPAGLSRGLLDVT